LASGRRAQGRLPSGELFAPDFSPTVRCVSLGARFGALIVGLTTLGLFGGVAAMLVGGSTADDAVAAAGIIVGAATAWLARRRLVPGGRGSNRLWLVAAVPIGVALVSAPVTVRIASLSFAGAFLAVCSLIIWQGRALGRHS
jgi:hypothetical protein